MATDPMPKLEEEEEEILPSVPETLDIRPNWQMPEPEPEERE